MGQDVAEVPQDLGNASTWTVQAKPKTEGVRYPLVMPSSCQVGEMSKCVSVCIRKIQHYITFAVIPQKDRKGRAQLIFLFFCL